MLHFTTGLVGLVGFSLQVNGEFFGELLVLFNLVGQSLSLLEQPRLNKPDPTDNSDCCDSLSSVSASCSASLKLVSWMFLISFARKQLGQMILGAHPQELLSTPMFRESIIDCSIGFPPGKFEQSGQD